MKSNFSSHGLKTGWNGLFRMIWRDGARLALTAGHDRACDKGMIWARLTPNPQWLMRARALERGEGSWAWLY